MRRILHVWGILEVFGVLGILLLGWQPTAWGAEREPIRVVQLPLETERTFQQPSSETVHTIDGKVSAALHAPLSETLGSVEYVSDREVQQAEEKLKAEGKSSYLSASYEQQLEWLGRALKADFVVLPRLTAYEQYTYMSWWWKRGTMLHSYVAMELYIYDRTADKTEKKRTSRFYEDEFSASGMADRLAQECMDSLLERTRLHEKFWSQVKSREQADNESQEE